MTDYLTDTIASRFGLTATATCIGAAPSEWGSGATRWNVVLTNGTASMPVDYKMGSAHNTVELDSLLDCLCSDARLIEDCDIDEACAEYGMKPSAYLLAVEQSKAFKALVGDGFDQLCEALADW